MSRQHPANKPFNLIFSLLGLMVVMGFFFAIGIKFMGKEPGGFLKGFPTVLVLTFLLGQKVLKIEPKTLNMVVSAAMSVCGTSAAIAAAAACKAKKKELTLSIGLATNFKELAHHFKGGKPLILYTCGQGFNLTLTLIMAYIMFYLVFPEITAVI